MTLSRRVTEKFSDAEFGPFIEPEAELARALYIDGFIRQIWHRDEPGGGACLLIEATSEAEVRETLATLPLVAAGMLEVVSVTALRPYGGFGPRLTSEAGF